MLWIKNETYFHKKKIRPGLLELSIRRISTGDPKTLNLRCRFIIERHQNKLLFHALRKCPQAVKFRPAKGFSSFTGSLANS